MGKLSIRLFGRLGVTDGDGGKISVAGKKPQALLAYLALNAGQPQSRDKLAALLWGERFDEQARQSLRQAISKLKKALDDDDSKALVTEGNDVVLNIGAADIDAVEFERLASEGTSEALDKADGLYVGGLLEGLEVKEKGFEDWIGTERSRFGELAADVLEKLSRHQAESGDTVAAIETAKRLIAVDPLGEEGHRTLMRLYAETGKRAQALKQFQTLEAALRSELNAEPEPKTRSLYEEIQSNKSPEPASGKPDPAAAAAISDKPSIAVLPFTNMSGDPEQEYFADGMAEDIITGLSRFRSLFVISRNSSFAYKDKSPDVREVASDLGVRYVLEGSVQRQGERIRITGQLVDAETGNQLWAERYDRELEDIFAVQDEVTEGIVAAIAPEIGGVERKRAQRKDPGNLDAWSLYQRGLAIYYSSTEEGLRLSIEQFDRVNEIDPTFAPAFAMAANARARYVLHFIPDNQSELLNQAREKAYKAITLDPQDPTCLWTDGRVHAMLGHHDIAISQIKEAIALNPNDAMSNYFLGWALCSAGRAKEAIPHIDQAMRLSPRDIYLPAFLSHQAFLLFDLERYEEALEWAQRARLSPNPRSMTFAILAAALTKLGRTKEAKAALNDLLAHVPDITCDKYRGNAFGGADAMARFTDALREAGLPE